MDKVNIHFQQTEINLKKKKHYGLSAMIFMMHLPEAILNILKA